MSTLAGDFWVCAECRSINNAGAKQCYNCRTPRDLAAVDPATIEGTGHGKLREIALPAFHSPKPFAAVASILILATAGLQVVQTVGITTLWLQVLGGTAATEEQLQYVGIVGLIALAVGAGALVMWSLWLSRAVTAMPALGLGYPAAGALMAFVENFLPGLNLLRVPAIVRDVVRRLEPGTTAGQSRGEALIFAAWVALLGGFIVPRVSAFLSGFSADSPASAIRTQLTIAGVAAGLVLVGAIFLVALIWWIEERIDRRREAQLAEIDATTARATDEHDDVDEAPPEPTVEPGTAVTSPRITEPPATWSWGGVAASPLAGSVVPAMDRGGTAEAAGAEAGAEPAYAREPVGEQATAEPATAEPVSAREPAAQPATAEPATAREPAVGQPPDQVAMPPAAGWEAPPTEGDDAGRHRWADWPRPTGSGSADDAEPEAMASTDDPAEPAPAPVAEEAVAEEVVAAPEAEPITAQEPVAPEREIVPEPVAAEVAPKPEPESEPVIEQQPAAASALEPEPEPAEAGAPQLTIRVLRMGMIQAEMAGETEPVILEDLPSYGTALANAGGSARIVVTDDDAMAQLIARRAQRILADAGIEATIPD